MFHHPLCSDHTHTQFIVLLLEYFVLYYFTTTSTASLPGILIVAVDNFVVNDIHFWNL